MLMIYFHLTLQENWKELGIRRELVSDVLRAFFPFLFVMSAIHACFGKKKERPDGAK